jgi:hypothetical protein
LKTSLSPISFSHYRNILVFLENEVGIRQSTNADLGIRQSANADLNADLSTSQVGKFLLTLIQSK